jgi:hypothetical protein
MTPTPNNRHKLVAWALAMTENTKLAPSPQERYLLLQYAQGALSLDQVLAQLPPGANS